MNHENRATNASLSTMWAINNYPDLNDFFATAQEMGFQKIELNHQINSSMLANVNLNHTQFSSIHEPCPADISMKDLVYRDWLISSPDESSRKQGVEAVGKSINLAHNLGAATVVIHCGNVSSNMELESKLRYLFEHGKEQSEEYNKTKIQFVQSRAERAGPRLQAVKKSLIDLLGVANRLNVKLGLENRYHFMDIPSIDELGELLSLGDPDQLGFIYDVGHAQALDRLGFYPHEEWLKRYSSRMFGTHLHDVIGVTDHCAPGLGEIDFKVVAKYLPEKSFRTIEVQPGNTREQVEKSLQILVEAGCIRYL